MRKLEKFSLYEAPRGGPDKVVFTFGRFNPPTTGHEKLINKVKSVAGSGDYKIYPSHSQNQNKDPLPHALKVAYMRKMFPKHSRNIIADKNARNAMEIMTQLYNQGYSEVIMVVGSDRVREFDSLIQKYNNVQGKRHGFYNFNKISVVSAGDRDPDAEGVTGMSASKLRQLAIDGKVQEFESGLPRSFKDGRRLYRDLRRYMGIREEKDMGTMTDYESLRDQYLTGKIWNIGETVVTENATGKIIQRGTNYLAFADEDNKVHRAWLHDIIVENDKVRQDKDVKDKKGTQPAKYYAGKMAKSTKDRRDAHFKKMTKRSDDDPDVYKKAPGDDTAKTKPSKHTQKFKQMYGEKNLKGFNQMYNTKEKNWERWFNYKTKTESIEHLNEKIDGLVKKAEKSGMPYSILKKVYDRGMAAWRTGHRPGTTPQQWAFARVNSFVTKSSGTWGGADKDLAKQVRGKSESYSYPNEYAVHTREVTPGQKEDKKKYRKVEMAQVTEWFESEDTRNKYQERYGDDWWWKLNETHDLMIEKVGKVDLSKSDGVTRVKSFSGKPMIDKRPSETPQEPAEKKESLWANIHKKRQRIKQGSGERMRKKGEKGAPTSQQMKRAKGEQLSFEQYLQANAWGEITEDAEYQGKKVKLNNPTRGDVKKFKVYVRNDKGNVVKVEYGDPNMEIKRDDPARRKSFRARHNCDNPGPKYKARYWSCKFWSANKSVSDLMKG